LELDGRLYIDTQTAVAFNGAHNLLALLLQHLLLNRQVLDDGHGIVNACKGGDVVESGIACQRAR
jgi:hypothetical protein